MTGVFGYYDPTGLHAPLGDDPWVSYGYAGGDDDSFESYTGLALICEENRAIFGLTNFFLGNQTEWQNPDGDISPAPCDLTTWFFPEGELPDNDNDYGWPDSIQSPSRFDRPGEAPLLTWFVDGFMIFYERLCGPAFTYLRQKQRDDRHNTPRVRGGVPNAPTSIQHSIRKSRGNNSYR